MKKLRFLPVILAVILSSCAKNFADDTISQSDSEGLLQISLNVDDGVQIVQSKADDSALDESLVPLADSLWVELYRFGKRTDKATKETWNRVYFGQYEDAKDTVFRVNAGQWKLLAFHGDSTACGFDKPYFKAEEEFTVEGGLDSEGKPSVTYIETEAKVSNVRISVDFDETVPGSFYDYFIRLSNIDTLVNPQNKKYKQILRYKKGEERDAYMMPTDSLQIEFMAQYEYGDESAWKYAVLDTIAVKGNDHIKVGVTVTDPRYGKLDVNIVTDDNIEETIEDVEISESWAPQDPPQIVAAGFVNGDHAVVEGDEAGNGATISVVARGGIRNFFIRIDSDYLNEAGIDVPVGVDIDLADPATDQALLDKLSAAGISWQDGIKDSRKLTYLTLTSLFAKINTLNPSLSVERLLATFTIKVVDNVGKETDLTLTATAYPVVQTLSIPEGRVWARKIVSPELTVSQGVSSLFMLQVSQDGGTTWEDCTTFESAVNKVLDFGTIAVEPSTEYSFRTIYNDNANLVSNVVTVVTEDVLQVGNPGFEEYHTTIMHVSPAGWLYDYDREWYLPYNEGETDPWWAVNSKMTMPDGHTAWTSNFCKNFPCTAFSTNSHSGDKSAMVYTVNVSSLNTDDTAVGTNVPGEIWIGTADDSGNHVTDGHAFASRPTSVKFWYRYAPLSGETFVVHISIKDAAGNEIARSEKLDGPASAEWAQCEIPVLYSNTETKAASIYMSFKSCASGSVKTAVTMEIAGEDKKAHIGSVLRIDDVELIY